MSGENWDARRAELANADGDEWDRLHDAYEADWIEAYCDEFRLYAKSRGWSAENIASGWLDDLPRDAMIMGGSPDPVKAAQADVLACEQEV